jgi:DNA-binding response OmpR family regulator
MIVAMPEPKRPLSVLMIEDNPGDVRLVRQAIDDADESIRFEIVGTLHAGVSALASHGFDAVLLDLSLPDSQGLDTVRRVLDRAAKVPVIVMTSLSDEDAAVCAVSEGAQDYLVKGAGCGELVPRAIRYAIERHRLQHRLMQAEKLEAVGRLAGAQRLESLVSLGQGLASERNPVAVLRLACGEARHLLLAQFAAVATISLDARRIDTYLRFGDATAEQRPPDDALDGEALRSVIDKRESIRRASDSEDAQVLGLPGASGPVHSYLAVPLASPTRVYGWLSFENKLGCAEFSDSDERTATMLGVQAAIAYENGRLLEELRRVDERTQFALAAGRMGLWEFDVNDQCVEWSQSMSPLYGLTARHTGSPRADV